MKIQKKEQLNLLQVYLKEVVESVNENICILNDNYGTKRDVDKDLGGYIQLIQSLDEFKLLYTTRFKLRWADYNLYCAQFFRVGIAIICIEGYI